MKEMIYKSRLQSPEILFEGKYEGIQFYILTFGAYPTAYVEIPKNHKFYGKEMQSIDLDVHGGITFSSDHLFDDRISWFIGWDYSHYEDYVGYELMVPLEFRVEGKKYSTEEIYEEVKYVIQQLKE